MTTYLDLYLEGECGVTQISLRNAEKLIRNKGLPDRVELRHDPGKEQCVDAQWASGSGEDTFEHTFTGLSWGYGGEGPHGLVKFLAMLGCVPPFSIEQVARFPFEGIMSLVLQRGKDYGRSA